MKFVFYNYILLLAIGLSVLFLFSECNYMCSKESFTPYIREMYRPYIRNTRVMTETIYNKYEQHIHNMLRKIGMM